MAVKKKHGGKRNGAGRHPVEDKKEGLFIYIKGTSVKLHGGRKAVKAFAEAAVEKKANTLTTHVKK